MANPFGDKQIEFIINSHAPWNLAHGAVRAGKTECTLWRFLQAADECPDSSIWMVGHSSETIYQNAIRLIFECPRFFNYRPCCTWHSGKRQLSFKDKVIGTLGAKDEGALGAFMGKTFSLVYCDEMTLYPESIIDMIDTRLSMPHSMGFASMNPSHPGHKIKKWIDKAAEGDPKYYALHFNISDNPFLDPDYVDRIRHSLSGLFYQRNYMGIWCLAEGAIFDFFDKNLHVVSRPPANTEYWIAGIDYGMSNPFACLLIAVSTGKHFGHRRCLWVEKEYFWDPKKTHRQKTVSELATDVQDFLEPYGVRNIYIDPSAEAFSVELRKRGIHVTDALNDVQNGISYMTSEMMKGSLLVSPECPNLIREIETYTWDPKKGERGEDAPIKKDDHCVDALRYSVLTHKLPDYTKIEDKHDPDQWRNNRFNAGGRRF